MILPPMPKGVEKDDAVHGRIYYTRLQMISYGQQCVDLALSAIYESEEQRTDGKSSVEELFNIFGMTK